MYVHNMKTSYTDAHTHINTMKYNVLTKIESQLEVFDNLKNQTGLLENDMEKYLHGIYFM